MIAAVLLAALQSKAPEADRIAKACADAFGAKDKAWFERHLAPGFVYQDLKGERQGRGDTLDRLGKWFHPLVYHVEASLALVSSRKSAGGAMVLVSDLRLRSQLFGFGRMPLTETTVRVESRWRPSGKEWIVERIVELASRKTVDGKPVSD